MALCFSPVGEDFRRRARQFPALVNCTVIDWFQPWPEDALYNVASQFLQEIELGNDEVRESVVRFMPYSFKRVNEVSKIVFEKDRRYIYTTPKSFLELIKLFKTMLRNKRNELENNKERYESGLVKLRETADMVAGMEEDLKIKQVEVDAKKASADQVAETVGAAKAKVEAETEKANTEAAKCQEMQKRVEADKADAQKELDAAEPLVEKAQAALQDISTKDFQMAKSFASPPKGVPEVFSTCVYLLAGLAPDTMIETDKNKKPKAVDWKGGCLKMMKDPNEFKKQLLEAKIHIDDGKMPAQNINPIRPLMEESYFSREVIINKSAAAAGVCEFIRNIVQYYDVVKTVEPKRIALREATEQLDAANAKLDEMNALVASLNKELAEVQAQFDEAIGEKNAVVAQAERLANRLSLAKRLISALGSEDARWAQSIIDLDEFLEVIVGDVLMSSSFVSYAGPFTKLYREDII